MRNYIKKNGLNDYIAGKEDMLKEFFIYNRMKYSELLKLRSAESELQADQIVKSIIDKYL